MATLKGALNEEINLDYAHVPRSTVVYSVN